MKRTRLLTTSIHVSILTCLSVATSHGQTLTHRYSFNETAGSGSFSDSVGGAGYDGTLLGGTLDGSQLQLDGLNSFAQLPSGIISNYTQVTFECWVTVAASNPFWTRLFSFGDQTGNAEHTGIDYCPSAGGNYQNLNFQTTNAGVYINNHGDLLGLTNVHLTVIVDPVANKLQYFNSTTLLSSGVNGNGGVVPPLSGLINTYSLLGRSLFDVDSTMAGSFDEFRIYSGPLTSQQLALNDAAGPNNYITDPGTLTAVHLTSPANPLVVNENSQQLFSGDFSNVTGLDLNLYGGTIYTSGNSAVLTVSSSGLVHAVAPGTTTVVASFGGKSATNTLTVVTLPAVLTHRYSFTSDASDSVGGANGTLMGAATVSGGKAVLDGVNTTYVDLPGSLINFNTNKAVTIDTWVDFGASPGWSRLFDFGHSDASSELYAAPNGPGNGNMHRFSQNFAGGRNTDWNKPWVNQSLHLTFVVDPPTGTMALYKNGVLEYARYDATAPLSLVSNDMAVIGHSLVGVDPGLPALIDEFRIYSGALSPAEIARSQASGPNSTAVDPGALSSITVLSTNYPANSGIVPPAILANYANLAGFNMVPNNSAVVGGLTVTSSDPTIIAIKPNSMLQTFRPGTVTLTASYLGKTNSAVVTVRNMGTLTHRYSFASDVSDSVGGANGALQGSTSVSGGNLVLDGAGGSYATLPAGILDGYDAITVDSWVNFGNAQTWARLWFFGDDRANEFYFSPVFGGSPIHTFQAGLTIGGGGRDGNPPFANQAVHLTCVFGNGRMATYTNGILESATTTITGRADEIGTNFAWIGRSPYPDPYQLANVDEFRIYRGGLAPDEIRALDAIGPNATLSTSASITAQQSGSTLLLSWPVAAAGFSVQGASNINGPWTVLTNAPTLTGSTWQVTLPDSSSNQFLRLWR